MAVSSPYNSLNMTKQMFGGGEYNPHLQDTNVRLSFPCNDLVSDTI